MTRHKFTSQDLEKRRGDRRRMALAALDSARKQHGRNPVIEPTLTALELAQAWKVHPTSAYRVLERLRRQGAVRRAGVGLRAEYEITERGLKKLQWLKETR